MLCVMLWCVCFLCVRKIKKKIIISSHSHKYFSELFQLAETINYIKQI